MYSKYNFFGMYMNNEPLTLYKDLNPSITFDRNMGNSKCPLTFPPWVFSYLCILWVYQILHEILLTG